MEWASLTWKRYTRVRYCVAFLCMALAVMLSAQTCISLMDRIQHAQHHAHYANPFAGGVVYSDNAPSMDHHHHHGDKADSSGHSHVADANEGHRNFDGAPVHPHHSKGQTDHQHGDATVLFLAAQTFVLAGCPITSLRCDVRPHGFVSFAPRGPDHPPKPTSEIRV